MSYYRIILRGVMEGRSVDQVAESLARFSKKKPDALRSLLQSGRDVLAKRTMEVQQAVRYKQALEKMGCICLIQAEITAAVDTSTSDSSAISVHLTNFADSRSQPPPIPRDFHYADAPVAVRMAGLRPWLGAFVLVCVCYYGWKILF